MDELIEEDEDVVFENSPLFQHLKEVGMDGDFESSTYTKTADGAPTEKELHVYPLTLIKSWFQTVISYALPTSRPITSLPLAPRVALLNSKVLMSGDHQWLMSYGLKEKNIEEKNKQSNFNVLIFANSATFGSIACLWFLFQNSSAHQMTSKLILLAVLLLSSTLIGLCHLAKFTVKCYFDYKRSNLGKCLYKQLNLMELMDSCIKNSLRNIQEAELIARGFTIISHKVPLMKLEKSSLLGQSRRQHQQLREAVFKASLSQFSAYRESTRHLLQQVKLQSEVDNIANYIANVSEDDLGFERDLKKIANENWTERDHQHLSETSDNFSLSAIKVVWQTMAVQRSEFLRRFGLSVCPKAWDVNGKDIYHILPTLEKVTTSLILDTQENLQELQRISDIHKSSTKMHDQGICRTSLASTSKGEYGELWTAAHSLYLHLQSAAARVHELQQKCDTLNQGNSQTDENIKADLNSLLETVNPELKASLACYQEVETKLNKLFTNSKNSPDVPINSLSVGNHSENIPCQPIQLFGLKDDEIRFDDETFEAYTDPNEGDTDGRFSHGNSYQEETEKQRKERQASLQLLQELRSVLPGKMEVREQLKQKGREKGTQQKDNPDVDIQESQELKSLKMVCEAESGCDTTETRNLSCSKRNGTKYDFENGCPGVDENTSEMDKNPDIFSNNVVPTCNIDKSEPVTPNHYESMESEIIVENAADNDENIQRMSLPPPQFGGGLWGMASLASQAASMSSSFQQQEEIFGSDTDESE